jgi:hypothetical protein
MATNFPATLDVFVNPTSTTPTNSSVTPHADQHANANDAIEALQAKVGIDNSLVPTSLDFQIKQKPTIVVAPAAINSTGVAGQIAYDTEYLYVCIATNTWRRTPLAIW